jgi:hypothetical protein
MDLAHAILPQAAAAAGDTWSSSPTAAQKTEPGTFFSLPRELRDEIYDILHQHEQQEESGAMTFRFPLSHVRSISRRFTTEYDQRTPTTRRLVVSQGCWCWSRLISAETRIYSYSVGHALGELPWSVMSDLPKRRPEFVTLANGASFTDLELNFDFYDEIRESIEFWHDSNVYTTWIIQFTNADRRLPKSNRGGNVHLRLFFRYLDTYYFLKRDVARLGQYNLYCNKISLVLYQGQDGTPSEASLSRARVLAVWTSDLDWQEDEKVIEECRAEMVRARQAIAGP